MNFHMLFEQSGTFKKAFKRFGHQVFDYDILNEYGETDFQIDLFNEIEKEYDNIINFDCKGLIRNDMYCFKTIFTNMEPDKDFIIAFFPCTYFTDINELIFTIRQSTKNKITMENINEVIKRSNQTK